MLAYIYSNHEESIGTVNRYNVVKRYIFHKLYNPSKDSKNWTLFLQQSQMTHPKRTQVGNHSASIQRHQDVSSPTLRALLQWRLYLLAFGKFTVSILVIFMEIGSLLGLNEIL